MGCLHTKTSPENFHTLYTCGEKLGSGLFAEVFNCIENSTGKRFAVKQIGKKKLVDESFLDAEVEILTRVKGHKNILSLHAIFDEEEFFYIITEFCEGGDLFNRIIEEGFSSEKSCVDIMKQLVSAIDYIHKCGVTHRDLKPENILLSNKESTEIKVADFGLSKLYENGNEVMRTTCGTWAYCAPEIIQRKYYTQLVDNWTLGVLMYIILSGYHPFDVFGDTPEGVLLERIENAEFDFEDEVWEGVSSEAKDIISGFLQVRPKDRMTLEAFLESDWVNGKVQLNSEHNEKVIDNLKRIVEARRKMKVTMLTVRMAAKFKAKLKLKMKLKLKKKLEAERQESEKKAAWSDIVPQTDSTQDPEQPKEKEIEQDSEPQEKEMDQHPELQEKKIVQDLEPQEDIEEDVELQDKEMEKEVEQALEPQDKEMEKDLELQDDVQNISSPL